MQQETSKEGSGQAPLLRTSSHWRTVRNVRNKLLSTGKKLSKGMCDCKARIWSHRQGTERRIVIDTLMQNSSMQIDLSN